MSSHHFVKEGQEPALFIAEALSFELAEPLLEWAPLVIVCDAALDEVLHWGIKIDVVLGEVSAIPMLQEKLIEQTPVKILSYQSDEDPLENGLHFLIASKNTAVNILTGSVKNRLPLAKNFPQIQVVLMDRDRKWSLYAHPFEKWVPAGTSLLIHPNDSSQKFTLTGLTSEGERVTASADGLITIESDNIFWIGESL
jgi:hypothetical protein